MEVLIGTDVKTSSPTKQINVRIMNIQYFSIDNMHILINSNSTKITINNTISKVLKSNVIVRLDRVNTPNLGARFLPA
jgi:hypothetical protein